MENINEVLRPTYKKGKKSEHSYCKIFGEDRPDHRETTKTNMKNNFLI